MKPFHIDTLKVDNEENLVGIRDVCRKICEQLGFTHTDQVRVTTSVSEITRNIYEYAKKGSITFQYLEESEQRALKILAEDQGPGIRNLEKILKGNYVSRTGMGAGIRGARALMDEFSIVSDPGRGTSVTMIKFIPPGAIVSMDSLLKTIEEMKSAGSSPNAALMAELETQNQELLIVLQQLNESNTRLETTNQELMETNQGIVALNNEISGKNKELDDLNRNLHFLVGQLKTKNDELKSFNYTVSHDLKAPLRGIAGYSQELIRKHSASLTERSIFCVNQIASASKQLDNLIEDLLKFSRLETDMIQDQKVQIKPLVDQILDQFRRILEGRPLELTSEVQDVEILGSANGLLHAISNLVDNAIKYSGQSAAPKIHVFAGVSDNQFKFVITDNGIGFDMKYHNRLFELFHRLVRQEEFEGTGAGLAIVKKIIDKHRGRIWGESEPGKGAKFTFVIPVGT